MSTMGVKSGRHFNSEKYTAMKLLPRNTLFSNELTNWLTYLFHLSPLNAMK